MASKLPQNNARIIVDLAFAHTILGQYFKENNKSEANVEFAKGKALYEAAERIEPTYPLLYSNWSVLDFYICDYVKAKEHLDKATSLGFKPDPTYLKELEDKLNVRK